MQNNNKAAKTIGRLQAVILFLLAAVIFIFIFFGIKNSPATISQASPISTVTQEIIPLSPLQEVTAVDKSAGQLLAAAAAEYRLIHPLVTEADGSEVAVAEAVGPLITFQGETLYPESVVILEFNSATFYVTRQSDAYGRWSWTNYGQLLAAGEHTITVYNIVPVESLAISNVYIQRYKFQVLSKTDDIEQPSNFTLSSMAETAIDNQSATDKIFSSENQSGLYLYSIRQLDQKPMYKKGEDFSLEFTIVPIVGSRASEADIKNTIYLLEDNGAKAKEVTYFTEKAPLSSNVFRKIFTIADYVTGGTYVLKSEATIGDKVFVQHSIFDVEPNHFVTLAGSIVDKDETGKVIIWNIIFFLLVIVAILIVALLEFRRIFVYHPLDEEDLNKLGVIKSFK
jgi:hypothetical protein